MCTFLYTYRVSTAHAVADILGGVAFNPLSHDATMTSVQTSDIVHKVDIYSARYVEAILEFRMDSQRSIERASQVVHWMNILPCARSHRALGEK